MRRLFVVALASCWLASSLSVRAIAQSQTSDQLVQLVIEWLGDDDKDVRALALQQVRSQAPGSELTERFAEQLPRLPAEAQIELLGALADRGDAVARPAVLELIANSSDESVRAAGIEALGALGRPSDVPALVEWLGSDSQAQQRAAHASLARLTGQGVSSAIAAKMRRASPTLRVALIDVLVQRRAADAADPLLEAAVDSDLQVRRAAMRALGELAGPEHVPRMLRAVLVATPGAEREAAEKAVMFVCSRSGDPQQRAEPVLQAMREFKPAERTDLLSALGRVGGPGALESVEEAIGYRSARVHQAGIRALCNWPDASVASRLMELARSDPHPQHRIWALRALIRVAPLPDDRSDGDRLELLQQAMALCTRDAERKLVLDRARAIRTVESLRFVVPYLDKPAYAQQACKTVVELAHHRGLREPNKEEFDRALDKVIATSEDATVIERAQRYQRGQTWAPPMTTEGP